MLLPGLVELHTDNMEKHFTPRPGVAWPAVSAFKTHDAQMVAAGITTVFDAVSIGDIIDGSERLAKLTRMVDSLAESCERGMAVLMGAPNVVRGGSHSGNIAAHLLASDGLLDVLSSDYCPTRLLDGAIRIAMLDSNDYDLPRAIALVTRRPADAAGLDDRGRIETGAAADLIWARVDDRREVHVEHVWKDGRRVF